MSSDTSRSAPSGADGERRACRGPRPAPAHRKPRERSGSGFFGELPFLVVIAFLLALLIKAFLVQAFYIPSGSMQQTLELRDRVLVNKLVYDFRDIHRGEVVVFNGLDSFTPETEIAPPSNGLQRVLRAVTGAVGVGAPGEKDFIKRVIGVPGDRVACCSDGKVTVQPADGSAPVELDEPYVFEDDRMVFCEAGTGEASCPPGAHRACSSPRAGCGSWATTAGPPPTRASTSTTRTTAPSRRTRSSAARSSSSGRSAAPRCCSVPETFDGALAALGPLPSYGLAATPYAARRGRGAAGRRAAPSLAPAPVAPVQQPDPQPGPPPGPPPGPLRLSVKGFARRRRAAGCCCSTAPTPTDPVCAGGSCPAAVSSRVRARSRRWCASCSRRPGSPSTRAAVGPLVWTQESTFVFRSMRRWARCHGRVVRVGAAETAAATVLTDDEQGSILGTRWWTPQELAATGDRFFPRHVPALLPRLLAGERVDEPFDVWD